MNRQILMDATLAISLGIALGIFLAVAMSS